MFAPVHGKLTLTPLCQCVRHLTPQNDTAPAVGGGDVDVGLAMVPADPAGSEAPSVCMSLSTRFTQVSLRSPAVSLKTFSSPSD